MISYAELMRRLTNKYGVLDGMEAKNCAKHGFMYIHNGKCIICIEEEMEDKHDQK